MPSYPVTDIIAMSKSLFGYDVSDATGALSGLTGSMDVEEARQRIAAWLSTPYQPGGTYTPPRPLEGHPMYSVLVEDPVGEEGEAPVVRSGKIVWESAQSDSILRYGALPGVHGPILDAAILAHKAAYPGGRPIVVPPGDYDVLQNHDLTGAAWPVRGAGAEATRIWASADRAGAALSLPRFTRSSGFSLIGPGVGGGAVLPSNYASAPALCGINLGDQSHLEDVWVSLFQNGVEIEGNHQALTRVRCYNNRRQLAWVQQNRALTVARSGTHGNQDLSFVDLTGGGECSIYVGPNSKIDSAELREVHMGVLPVGILCAAKGSQDAAVINTAFHGCSFESVGESYILDQGFNTANRRLFKGLRFYEQHDGPMDAAYSRTGSVGTEMVRVGTMRDWEVHGLTGDAFNSTFPLSGSGAGGCGFLAEIFDCVVFYNMDQLWADCAASGRPAFKLGGGAFQLTSVVATLLRRFTMLYLRNSTGATLIDGYVVSTQDAGDIYSGGFTFNVKHASGDRMAIGRVAGGGSLATGGLVPVVISGGDNVGPVVTATGIVAGSPLCADPANPGRLKLAGASDQVIGRAFGAPSGGTVVWTVLGPVQPAI